MKSNILVVFFLFSVFVYMFTLREQVFYRKQKCHNSLTAVDPCCLIYFLLKTVAATSSEALSEEPETTYLRRPPYFESPARE